MTTGQKFLILFNSLLVVVITTTVRRGYHLTLFSKLAEVDPLDRFWIILALWTIGMVYFYILRLEARRSSFIGFSLLFSSVLLAWITWDYQAPPSVQVSSVQALESLEEEQVQSLSQLEVSDCKISQVFSKEVKYWKTKICDWSSQHGIDPDIVATIIQIESCGDPEAVSRAGAQGLFQVMPFHFSAGENPLDPDTNAERGIGYYLDRLERTNGVVGHAFAGYNGGNRPLREDYDKWHPETQRFFAWATGIYQDAKSGASESPTLNQWLTAGGASLCRQAEARLNLQ